MQTERAEDISKIILLIDYIRLEAIRLKLEKTQEHCRVLLDIIRGEQDK